MKISCMAGPKKSILLLIIDGEVWKEIHTGVWGNKPVFSSDFLSLQFFSEQFYELEYKAAKQYAFRKLAVKSYFIQELKLALQKVLISEKTVDKVIQEMIQQQYLDDQLQSERWVRTQAAKKWGPHIIAQKLRAKGVFIENLPSILEAEYGSEERRKKIQLLLSKKLQKSTDFSSKQKAIASLMRKGFDLDEIQNVLKTEHQD